MMRTRLFALFTDDRLDNSPAFLFRRRRDAEHAIHACQLKDADIVSFNCHELINDMVRGMLYMALRCEDAGFRVLEAFRSPFTLQAFLMDHASEGNCRSGLAWLEPIVQHDRLIYGLDRRSHGQLPALAFHAAMRRSAVSFLAFEETHLREMVSE